MLIKTFLASSFLGSSFLASSFGAHPTNAMLKIKVTIKIKAILFFININPLFLIIKFNYFDVYW
jgi:hypothetical protein